MFEILFPGSLQAFALCVCVMSKVAYRLSCESLMIPKIDPPVCSPPVTIEKPCTSPYKLPCKLY